MNYIKINPSDNVAVALTDLRAGEAVCGVVIRDDVPRGHKVLLKDLRAGENVIKYGFPIGHVTRDAAAGTVVDHTCIKTNLEGLLEYRYEPVKAVSDVGAEDAVRPARAFFRGFRRADGQVGIRNQIWIIPTVGCVNGAAQNLANRFREEIAGNPGSVDAVVAFPHNYGCSQLGDDHENTRTVLADMVHHPNAGGVLVIGLGCENNQLDAFREVVGPVDGERVRMFYCQKVEDEIEYGLQQLRGIFAACSRDEREDVPVSELRVGLKCGGSDGLSGITANPLLGVFSDWIVEQGGTTVLTEVPEMFGAETLLMNRCQDRETFEKTVSLINDFKAYFMRNGQPVYENPSPGNKAGGISTLEEKSLGCTQKCGKSLVRGVLHYGERLSVKGLNLLSAPGNDLVASTALAASGCQIVLFTTGRGTPFGSFVPTMKISTNTPLAEHKPSWIDFNAGTLASGEPMEDVSARFIEAVLAAACGQPVNNEKNGFREIAIFKSGVTL
ncbi:MAG: altronate dehydratase family protein [Bacteroidales bacterium]|nr:altronate dehydratase family protein [Bacteroidales bacterium]